MTNFKDYLSALRWWTIIGCILAVVSVVVFFVLGALPAIYWAVLALFMLKLGDRE